MKPTILCRTHNQMINPTFLVIRHVQPNGACCAVSPPYTGVCVTRPEPQSVLSKMVPAWRESPAAFWSHSQLSVVSLAVHLQTGWTWPQIRQHVQDRSAGRGYITDASGFCSAWGQSSSFEEHRSSADPLSAGLTRAPLSFSELLRGSRGEESRHLPARARRS